MQFIQAIALNWIFELRRKPGSHSFVESAYTSPLSLIGHSLPDMHFRRTVRVIENVDWTYIPPLPRHSAYLSSGPTLRTNVDTAFINRTEETNKCWNQTDWTHQWLLTQQPQQLTLPWIYPKVTCYTVRCVLLWQLSRFSRWYVSCKITGCPSHMINMAWIRLAMRHSKIHVSEPWSCLLFPFCRIKQVANIVYQLIVS